MRFLPLYDADRRAAVERAAPLDSNPDCRRCKLGERTDLVNRCIPPHGAPGGLLIVGEGPGAEEDRSNRPFVGKSGRYLRGVVSKHWKGPVAFDNATRCRPPHEGKDRMRDRAADACRGYLRQTIDEVRPTRIVALGGWAAMGLLGRAVAPLSVRGGYGWLWNVGQPVPVFFVVHPAAALRNATYARYFEADLQRALTREVPALPPWEAEGRVVETLEDARAAARELCNATWFSIDAETFGRMHDPGFRVFSLALCARGSNSPWVFPLEALEQPAIVEQLQLIFDSADNTVQNGKYDTQALRRALNIELPVHKVDTRLVRKLVDPDALADLSTMSELVGLGGHKEENEAEIEKAKAVLLKWCRQQPAGPRRSVSHETVDDVMAEAWEHKKRTAFNAEVKAQRDAVRARGEKPPSRKPQYEGKAPPRWWTARDDWWTEDIRSKLGSFLYSVDASPLERVREGEAPSPSGDWLRDASGNPKLKLGVDSRRWSYALVDRDVSLRYNALDTLTTARLSEHMERQMEETPRIRKVWDVAIRPASYSITRVEQNGILINPAAIAAFSSVLRLKLGFVNERLRQYDCNFDSPMQLRELLFKKLGLQVVELTDSGLESTDHDSLAALRGQHPIVEDLLEYRRLTKLRGTYADGLIGHVQADGRVHASFHIDGARTGRLSSSEPNLQNCPRGGTDEGKLFRDCFVAPRGYVLVEGDFSQVELRVAAFLSDDQAMISIFNTPGADIHMAVAKQVAQQVWRILPEQVTDEHRSKVKTFVFGIIYGMSDEGIMQRTGCTLREAQMIREAVMGTFSRLGFWIKESIRAAHRQGGAYTWWDGDPKFRFRPLPALEDSDDGKRRHAENGAYNGPVQGTANEFCLQSLIGIDGWLEARPSFSAQVVLTVHDSIMCEVREDLAEELIEAKRKIMTSWNSCGVPLAVDFAIGRSWGSMVKLKGALTVREALASAG